MNALYDEALYASEPVRAAARAILRCLAEEGADPTQPHFANRAVDEYGSAAMQLLGYPDALVQPPYEMQAARLLDRLDDLKHRIPQTKEWFAGLSDACEDFWTGGERPADELVFEALLVLGEVEALFRHSRGEDVKSVMALYDAVAQGTGEAREDAVAALQQFVCKSKP